MLSMELDALTEDGLLDVDVRMRGGDRLGGVLVFVVMPRRGWRDAGGARQLRASRADQPGFSGFSPDSRCGAILAGRGIRLYTGGSRRDPAGG